jgi:hypothetical protein
LSRFDHFLERATNMAKRNGLTAILTGQILTMSKPGVSSTIMVSPARMPCDVRMDLNAGFGIPQTVKWMSLEAECRKLSEREPE